MSTPSEKIDGPVRIHTDDGWTTIAYVCPCSWSEAKARALEHIPRDVLPPGSSYTAERVSA